MLEMQRALEVDSQAVPRTCSGSLGAAKTWTMWRHRTTCRNPVKENPPERWSLRAVRNRCPASEDEDDKILEMLKKAKASWKRKGYCFRTRFRREQEQRPRNILYWKERRKARRLLQVAWTKCWCRPWRVRNSKGKRQTSQHLSVTGVVEGHTGQEEIEKHLGSRRGRREEQWRLIQRQWRKKKPATWGRQSSEGLSGRSQTNEKKILFVMCAVTSGRSRVEWEFLRKWLYSLSDYSKKLQWGKNRTLFRVHFAVSEILQAQLQREKENWQRCNRSNSWELSIRPI